MPDTNTVNWGVSERAAALHRAALVWDDHGGFAYEGPQSLVVLPRWRASGSDYLSIDAGSAVTPWTLAIERVSKYRQWSRERTDDYVQVERVDDIARARREGKL